MNAPFYMEIGCEEIPARTMARALDDLGYRLAELLKDRRLHYDRIDVFGSARRFVIHIPHLAERQEARTELTLGPPTRAAYKDGLPTAALDGFARKAGVPVDRLKVFTTDKGEYVGYETFVEGEATTEILAAGVPSILRSMTFPKMMTWSDRETRFSRPVRWIIARFGERVVPIRAFGVEAGVVTDGHRILGGSAIPVDTFEDYVERLRANFVIVSQQERQEKIEGELQRYAAELHAHVVMDDRLLQEVVFINEYPTVLLGTFEARFLDLPREILITVMKEHQKYFALESRDHQSLLPRFLAVINTAGDPRGFIRKGHERVLRARLSDALFFWNMDGKHTLEERRPLLKTILFQDRLGSYADKVKRVAKLARLVNRATRVRVPSHVLDKAVAWSKCDLTTDMVREFTDLQGIVGGLYARREGAADDIWRAIYDQYRPQSLEDNSPSTRAGAVLSIADRLDTVSGCFSLGLIPTGSEDPLGLRRQVQGIVKILLDQDLPFAFRSVARAAFKMTDERFAQLENFYVDRLRFILGQMGFAYDEINAVIAAGSDDPADVLKRIRAVRDVRQSADFAAISAAFKRIQNILRQADSRGEVLSGEISQEGMEAEEHALFEWVDAAEASTHKWNRKADYRKTLECIAGARPVVDRFFDKIMVMHQDDAIRRRRLTLLGRLSKVFSELADISEMVTP